MVVWDRIYILKQTQKSSKILYIFVFLAIRLETDRMANIKIEENVNKIHNHISSINKSIGTRHDFGFGVVVAVVFRISIWKLCKWCVTAWYLCFRNERDRTRIRRPRHTLTHRLKHYADLLRRSQILIYSLFSCLFDRFFCLHCFNRIKIDLTFILRYRNSGRKSESGPSIYFDLLRVVYVLRYIRRMIQFFNYLYT